MMMMVVIIGSGSWFLMRRDGCVDSDGELLY